MKKFESKCGTCLYWIHVIYNSKIGKEYEQVKHCTIPGMDNINTNYVLKCSRYFPGKATE